MLNCSYCSYVVNVLVISSVPLSLFLTFSSFCVSLVMFCGFCIVSCFLYDVCSVFKANVKTYSLRTRHIVMFTYLDFEGGFYKVSVQNLTAFRFI